MRDRLDTGCMLTDKESKSKYSRRGTHNVADSLHYIRIEAYIFLVFLIIRLTEKACIERISVRHVHVFFSPAYGMGTW